MNPADNLRHNREHQQAAAKAKAAKLPPHALSQIIAMQANLYRIAVDSSLEPKECAQAALAWERLEERKRILRGKPMPGSLRPEPKAKHRTRSVLPQPISEPEPLA